MLVALVLALSTAFASPDEDDDRGMSGMSGMPGMHGGMASDGFALRGRANDGARLVRHLPELAKALGLSDAQRDAIEQAYYDNKANGIDLEAKAEKARLELQRQLMAATLDEKAMLKAFDAVAAAEVETHRNDLRLLLAVRKQLTPDQWKQLTGMREQMRSMRREERREEREDRDEK